MPFKVAQAQLGLLRNATMSEVDKYARAIGPDLNESQETTKEENQLHEKVSGRGAEI